ncbi:MAG TPA: CRISPR-associated protein Csx19, partial [Blastocatellia bacterium]|nr:CRISPR-associated protein Csx19 [Blastocatellia bacterium]
MKWKRKIESCLAQLKEITVPPTGPDNLHTWLQEEAKEHELEYLLAHADDGVIWGKVESNGTLITSGEAAKGNPIAECICPPLRLRTLQQARLFGKDAELLLWRDGDNVFHARLIADNESGADWLEAYDEAQLLWGTQKAKNGDLPHGFTLLEDGAQGLRHAVPLTNLDLSKQRVQLMV